MLQALLALAAADELADARHQHVHGGHGLAVVVQAHIEGLDLPRVVEHSHRRLEVLLGQEALVLRLQVSPIVDRELELLAASASGSRSASV